MPGNAMLTSVFRIFFGGFPAGADPFLKVLIVLNAIVSCVAFIAYFHQHFYAVCGLFTKARRYGPAASLHKYAYLICAHDEERVIGNLIDSIRAQNYPQELMQIYVCADHCTDATAQIARERGAVVLERVSAPRGKSYALDEALQQILRDSETEKFDAVFIFDADNLLDAEYTAEMNKLFDKGIPVAASYRASKNAGANWIAAGSSYMFYRENALIHHSRSVLGLGTYVSGTGFYVSMELIRELGGWPYHTMTEDIEFSVDCAQKKIKIGYNENAVFYDEQPETMKASCRQRLRWCRGMHECYAKYSLKNWKKTLRAGFSPLKFEMLVHICPLPVITFVWTFLCVALQAIDVFWIGKGTLAPWFTGSALPAAGLTFLSLYLIAVFNAAIVVIRKHRSIPLPLGRQILYCLTFPLFMATFLPLSFVALFKKVQWKKVPHTVNARIEEIAVASARRGRRRRPDRAEKKSAKRLRAFAAARKSGQRRRPGSAVLPAQAVSDPNSTPVGTANPRRT